MNNKQSMRKAVHDHGAKQREFNIEDDGIVRRNAGAGGGMRGAAPLLPFARRGSGGKCALF